MDDLYHQSRQKTAAEMGAIMEHAQREQRRIGNLSLDFRDQFHFLLKTKRWRIQAWIPSPRTTFSPPQNYKSGNGHFIENLRDIIIPGAFKKKNSQKTEPSCLISMMKKHFYFLIFVYLFIWLHRS